MLTSEEWGELRHVLAQQEGTLPPSWWRDERAALYVQNTMEGFPRPKLKLYAEENNGYWGSENKRSVFPQEAYLCEVVLLQRFFQVKGKDPCILLHLEDRELNLWRVHTCAMALPDVGDAIIEATRQIVLHGVQAGEYTREQTLQLKELRQKVEERVYSPNLRNALTMLLLPNMLIRVPMITITEGLGHIPSLTQSLDCHLFGGT